jgi:hypothetical protein
MGATSDLNAPGLGPLGELMWCNHETLEPVVNTQQPLERLRHPNNRFSTAHDQATPRRTTRELSCHGCSWIGSGNGSREGVLEKRSACWCPHRPLRYTQGVFGIFRRQDPRFHDDGQALHARVRTSRKGEVIRVRLSKTSEFSSLGGGYFVRKSLVGPQTLDQAVLEVTTNRNHKVTLATIDGGELLPRSEWPAEPSA